MSDEKRWFRHLLRVRYAETDQMGVVYHANYLDWFEIGRTELIRQLGMPYRGIEERGLLLPLIDLEVKFRQPARYDDVVAIYTQVQQYSHLRLHFACEIRRVAEEWLDNAEFVSTHEPEGELLVSGFTRHVWVDRSFRPVRLDKAAPDVFRLLQDHCRQL